jgi:hypothetical protein
MARKKTSNFPVIDENGNELVISVFEHIVQVDTLESLQTHISLFENWKKIFNLT